MSNVNLANCRIEFKFYDAGCADAFDSATISEAEATDALVKASEGIEGTRPPGEAANSGADGAPEPESGDANEKKPPKISSVRVLELVRRAATGATGER